MSVTATATGLVRPRYRTPAPAALPSYEEKLERDLADLEDENQKLRLRLGRLQSERDAAVQSASAKDQSIARLRQTVAALRDSLAGVQSQAKQPHRQRYVLGRLTLNLTMREMGFDGRTIPLSPGESHLMAYLFARPRTLILTSELTTNLLGAPSKNSIRSYVSRIGVKLNTIGARGYLNGRQGWGAGGYWVTDPEAQHAASS